jgi:hypothetical protein
MSKFSKVGVVAAAISSALLLVGCASQGSGSAAPANVPNSCNAVTANACKNKAGCKQKASCSHIKKHHKKAVAKAEAPAVKAADAATTESK